jgi:acylphosphatase
MSDRQDVTSFRLKIEGFVQAVGYRNFAIEEAKRLGLHGWVRNRSNGDVEVLVSGDEEKVNAFITACAKGPSGSQVKNIGLEKSDPPSEEGFHRRPSL